MRHASRLLHTGLLALALVPSADAQIRTLPPLVAFDRVDRPPLEKTTAQSAHVRDEARAALSPTPSSGVSVLDSFSLLFMNTDHKIRRLGVLNEGRLARFIFADQDSNDPFRGEASWWTVPEGIEGEVSGTARGRAVIEVPAGPSGHVLVLRGFEVRRADRTDANVRTLGISLDGNASTATVVLSDDMGADWRGFETTLGIAALLAFVPPDGGTAAAVSSVDALSRLHNGLAPTEGQLPGRPFAFTVQYAWIPERFVVAERAASGYRGPRGDETGQVFNPVRRGEAEAPLALQGFSFAFGNSDHHLERVAVDFTNAVRDPSAPGAWLPAVYFKDTDLDDPMQWAVEYVTLCER